MQGKSMGSIGGVNRRHLVAGAVGALALPIATRATARGIEQPATEADTRFMRMAIEEATLGDYAFGTVIVREGEVLARGHNRSKQEKDPTAHGEMVAIRNFLKGHGPDLLKGTTLILRANPARCAWGRSSGAGSGTSFSTPQLLNLPPRSARSWSPTARSRARRRFSTLPSPAGFSPRSR